MSTGMDAQYLKISNDLGKSWILPSDNLAISFDLYQPSSLKGRLFKRLFPLANAVPGLGRATRKMLGVTSGAYPLDSSLREHIHRAFPNHPELSFAFFLGTPCAHQKTTIQISSGHAILGYCKITQNPGIMELFTYEKEILAWLRAKGVVDVPQCLLCRQTEGAGYAFIQSTKKTHHSRSPRQLTVAHIRFLRELNEKTAYGCGYCASEYRQTIDRLKSDLGFLNLAASDTQLLLKAIGLAEESLWKQSSFGAYHGDFTPWNMLFQSGKLFVFDFEYAKRTYPAMIDVFHYFTQARIHIKGRKAERIFAEFEKTFVRGKYKALFPDGAHLAYVYYLLAVIAHYAQRDQGAFSRDVAQSIKIWIDLIRMLVVRIQGTAEKG